MTDYLLKNGVVVNPEFPLRTDLRIRNGIIVEMEPQLRPGRSKCIVDCDGFFIYPGLINSPDHLEFNLYPKLGEPPYRNAYQWGLGIQEAHRKQIDTIERVPLQKRLLWGAWKNLFSGVTRVVHHNKYFWRFRHGFPLEVVYPYSFAHSLKFERNLRNTLQKRKHSVPFVIHLAEGTDEAARSETKDLDELGGLTEDTVAVHLVGVSEEDVLLMKRRKVSAVCCPSSNEFLFGTTAPIASLFRFLPMALGTDSTLTGSITMFDELRAARTASQLSAQELFSLVTAAPRKIFRMASEAGSLVRGGRADLFLLPQFDPDPYETILSSGPGDIQLLMASGSVMLFDTALNVPNGGFHFPLMIEGRNKCIADMRVKALYNGLHPFLNHYSYLNGSA